MNLTIEELRLVRRGLATHAAGDEQIEALIARVQRVLMQGGRALADPEAPITQALDHYLDAVAEVRPVTEQIEAWSAVMAAVHEALRARQTERES